MSIKFENIVIRPNGGKDYYGEGWFAKNIKIAQVVWDGPEPFSGILWPRYYSEVKRYGDAWFRFSKSYDMTFEILLDGTMEYTQNGIAETVHPGEIYVMHEGSDIVFHAGPESCFHRLRLSLCGTLVHSAARELRLIHHRILRPTNLEHFKEMFRGIASLIEERDEGKAPQVSAEAFRIMAELSECSRQSNPIPERLEQIISLMKSSIGSNFPIRDFAASRKIEIHTLMRLFRKYLNVSPHEYLNSLRMEEASQLVGSTELSMKEIAEKLGYANSLYFSSVFRRHFGIPPREYRRMRKNANTD